MRSICRDDNNDEDICELTLKNKLDIIANVAHSMEHFHHDSFVQVMHCYLKPNHVILYEDMLGHIIEFSIEKLIDVKPTNTFQHLL